MSSFGYKVARSWNITVRLYELLPKVITNYRSLPEQCKHKTIINLMPNVAIAHTSCYHFGFLIAKIMEWIDVKEKLPKQLEQCIFKLNDGSICIGKCNYFEFGDSELIEMYGKPLSYLVHRYRNWELHNFDRTKYFEVTHWASLS